MIKYNEGDIVSYKYTDYWETDHDHVESHECIRKGRIMEITMDWPSVEIQHITLTGELPRVVPYEKILFYKINDELVEHTDITTE